MSEYAHPEEEKKEMALLKIGELDNLAGVSSKALRHSEKAKPASGSLTLLCYNRTEVA